MSKHLSIPASTIDDAAGYHSLPLRWGMFRPDIIAHRLLYRV